VTPTLGVITPGLRTTVQDLGRVGYQSFGIGVSGALDPISLRAANALVGNPPSAGTLEVAYVGPTLAVEAEEVRFAFVGALAPIEVLPDVTAVSGRRIAPLRSVRLRRGEVVRVGSLSDGAVLYIAVEGGFDIAPVLGSLSTDTRGRFGGWQGRALLAKDRLPLCQMRPSDRDDLRLDDFDRTLPQRFRVILGPQHNYFSDSAIATFFDSEYTVSAHSDRIGIRLDGPPINQDKDVGFTSDGTAPGSIQVTGSGQPIVLMPDRQTTGGTPRSPPSSPPICLPSGGCRSEPKSPLSPSPSLLHRFCVESYSRRSMRSVTNSCRSVKLKPTSRLCCSIVILSVAWSTAAAGGCSRIGHSQ
jgi:biotin-dependent carboxylase-like uncharacterized protein